MSTNIKLYPPYIDGKIIAQVGSTLKIPFEMNRAVSSNEIKAISAKIKTATTSIEVATLTSINDIRLAPIAEFNIENILTIGQFYKIQLAYIDNNDVVGYYSTVGIFKYTAMPQVEISGLTSGTTNQHLSVYQGVYKNPGDITEKEYSYKFEVFNENELFYSSGEQIHNSENEIDIFSLPVMLSLGIRYTLTYTITTINGLIVPISYYIIDSVLSDIPSNIQGALTATLNRDEGCVSIDFVQPNNTTQTYAGNYRLLRFIDNKYEIIDTFIISTNELKHIYNDYTVQQGITYKYALQQVGDNIYGQKIYSNEVYADYEDMFLYDGHKQLKIKFNPKVASFKTTILEQKTDTLGGKYPIFFRNGNTSYKEFPISGLISILGDDNQAFVKYDAEKHTNLTADMISAEREFKLEVLNWLNNGKPKLFRSPTEGNYIVRIMNVSLSPNETLGRMLHTFSAQAYEIMDNNFNTLLENGLIGSVDNIISLVINQHEFTKQGASKKINSKYVSFNGTAGTRIQLTFANSGVMDVEIGYTGIYEVPHLADDMVTLVKVTSLKTNEILIMRYDETVKDAYPISFNGQQVFGIKNYIEKAYQFAPTTNDMDIIVEIKKALSNYHNFNLMSLTLTAKMPTLGQYSTTTLNRDSAGNIYTPNGVYTAQNTDTQVKIIFEDGSTEYLILEDVTLYENLDAQKWRIDSFGNITLTCDMFNGNRFWPKSIVIGRGVYANAYCSAVEYKLK